MLMLEGLKLRSRAMGLQFIFAACLLSRRDNHSSAAGSNRAACTGQSGCSRSSA